MHAGCGDGRHLAGDRIVEPEDGVIEREADEAALGLRVCREIAVAVEVIGGHVEHARDCTARLAHRLDLKRRELEDHPIGLDDAVEAVEHRHPDVPAEVDSLAGTLEDRRDERSGRRLAVGPGDAADTRSAALEDEVHLAAHGDAMGARDLELWGIPRHARTGADHERVRGDVVGVSAESDLDSTGQGGDALPDRRTVAAVHEDHTIALAGQRDRAGKTAATGADDDDGLLAHDTVPATCA